MLGVELVIETVAAYAAQADFPVVVNPVMVAASGDRLPEPDAEAAYEELIAESTVVTPNADEATVLTGIEPEGEASARSAGERLVEMGARAALIKGGHVRDGSGLVRDVLVTANEETTFVHPRVDTTATHGSGCTLSSAITA